MAAVALPCGHQVDAGHPSGERLVWCPVDGRSWVVAAVIPRRVTYQVVREHAPSPAAEAA